MKSEDCEPINHYLLSCRLTENTKERFDGRDWDQFLKLDIKSGGLDTAEGSSFIRIGYTTVTCGIKIKVGSPLPDKQDKGCLIANVELPPICERRFHPGPPSDEAQALSQWLQNTLIAAQCPDLHKLSIDSSGLYVYCVYIDVLVSNCDGCLHDACLLAAVAALRDTKFCPVLYDQTDNRLILQNDAEKVSFDFDTLPFAVSYGIMLSGRHLSQPTNVEERECGDTLIVVLDALKPSNVLNVMKTGGNLLSTDNLEECLTLTSKRSSFVKKLLAIK